MRLKKLKYTKKSRLHFILQAQEKPNKTQVTRYHQEAVECSNQFINVEDTLPSLQRSCTEPFKTYYGILN